jgi:hypothetical protein
MTNNSVHLPSRREEKHEESLLCCAQDEKNKSFWLRSRVLLQIHVQCSLSTFVEVCSLFSLNSEIFRMMWEWEKKTKFKGNIVVDISFILIEKTCVWRFLKVSFYALLLYIGLKHFGFNEREWIDFVSRETEKRKWNGKKKFFQFFCEFYLCKIVRK